MKKGFIFISNQQENPGIRASHYYLSEISLTVKSATSKDSAYFYVPALLPQIPFMFLLSSHKYLLKFLLLR